MEVLMMIGRYAGEIRDIKPVYARELIDRGDALDPNIPIAPEIDTVDVPRDAGGAKSAPKAITRHAGRS